MTTDRQSVKKYNEWSLIQTARKKHSASFVLSIFLILYAVFYFYVKSLLQDEAVERFQSYFTLSSNLILFSILFWKLFLSGKHMQQNIRNGILTSIISGIIVYLIISSGLEKLLGLWIILMSISVFQLYPLKRDEINVIYGLFLLAVVLILLNGTTELDAVDKSKFNPNACGFLLAMVFCVSLLRFARSKRAIDFVVLLGSFILQIFFMSRTATLGCLLFFILFVLYKGKKKKIAFKTAFVVLTVIPVVGIALAYLYAEVLFPWIGVGKITIFGKDLFTGRQEIWHYIFASIKEHFWFGDGSRVNQDLVQAGFYELITNAHNQSLGTIAAFGIFVFVVFSVAFAQVGSFTYKNAYRGNKYTRMPVLFLSVVCVMSWFDLYWFSQYNWVPIMISYCLICGYGKIGEKRV